MKRKQPARMTRSYHRSVLQSILMLRDDPEMDEQTFASVCRSRGVAPAELRELIETEKDRRRVAKGVAA